MGVTKLIASGAQVPDEDENASEDERTFSGVYEATERTRKNSRQMQTLKEDNSDQMVARRALDRQSNDVNKAHDNQQGRGMGRSAVLPTGDLPAVSQPYGERWA